MEALMRRAALFALYQLSIVLGIMLLPVALVASRAGLVLPINRLIERLGDAYQRATQ